MHKNLFWRSFLMVFFFISLGYTIHALYKLYNHSKLVSQASPSHLEWKIKKIHEDSFVLEGFYSFEYKGKIYPGEAILDSFIYKNEWGAQKDIPLLTLKTWTVWFDPAHPTYSSLHKKFPYKECISSIILWCLLVYFLWLGFYVGKHSRS